MQWSPLVLLMEPIEVKTHIHAKTHVYMLQVLYIQEPKPWQQPIPRALEDLNILLYVPCNFIPWNTVQQKRMNYWYTKPPDFPKTVCPVKKKKKKSLHENLHAMGFHLHDVLEMTELKKWEELSDFQWLQNWEGWHCFEYKCNTEYGGSWSWKWFIFNVLTSTSTNDTVWVHKTGHAGNQEEST